MRIMAINNQNYQRTQVAQKQQNFTGTPDQASMKAFAKGIFKYGELIGISHGVYSKTFLEGVVEPEVAAKLASIITPGGNQPIFRILPKENVPVEYIAGSAYKKCSRVVASIHSEEGVGLAPYEPDWTRAHSTVTDFVEACEKAAANTKSTIKL